MAGTTYKGIPYPTSSDSIAPLETWLENIAKGADNAGIAKGSATFTGPSATGSTVNVVVTFPTAFATAPTIIASVQGGTSTSNYSVTIVGAPSTTGFTANVYRLNGSTAETGLKLNWFASTYA
jgi:hypothetical protein